MQLVVNVQGADVAAAFRHFHGGVLSPVVSDVLGLEQNVLVWQRRA